MKHKYYKYIMFTIFLFTAALPATAWQLVPIDATLKAMDVNGAPTFDPASTVSVVGVVTDTRGCFHATNFQYWIQDTATGLGLQIYQSYSQGGKATNPDYAEGDLMFATGNIANYRGAIELVLLSGTTTEKIGTGYGYSTVVCYGGITAANFFDQTAQSGGELYDGRVFRLNNVHISNGAGWPAPGSNSYTVEISDATGGTLLLRLLAITGIPDDITSPPAGTFDIAGIGYQYNNAGSGGPFTDGYQLLPRDSAAFIDTTMVVIPGSANVSVGGTRQFSASGACPPYTWSLSNPTIGSINSTTGLFTASDTGSSNVIATDQGSRQGGASITVTIAPLLLSPSSTVRMTVGQTKDFTASGGLPPYTWSLSTDNVGSINTTEGATVTFSADSEGIVDLSVTDSSPGTPQVQTANITVIPTIAPLFIDAIDSKYIRFKLFE